MKKHYHIFKIALGLFLTINAVITVNKDNTTVNLVTGIIWCFLTSLFIDNLLESKRK
jgi:hypothetical protein